MAQEPLKCPICDEPASARLQLDKHLLSEHSLHDRIEWVLDAAEREREVRQLADIENENATETAEIETD